MVAFRVESGLRVGTGHLSRCLALAEGFRTLGWDCAFLSCSRDVETRAKAAGHAFRPVGPGSFTPKGEIASLGSLERETGISLLVADSYLLTPQVLASLDRIVSVAYIDDLQSARFDVSAVVNGNITGDADLYGRRYGDTRTLVLCGTKYCIMREEFSNLNIGGPRGCVRDVLVSTGGTDPHDASLIVSGLLLGVPALSDARIHVLAGALNPNVRKLQEASIKEPRLVVHVGLSQVSSVMLSCDMAVAAAGTTLNELCACGVPTVAYSLVGNQDGCSARFEGLGAAVDAGSIEDNNFKVRVTEAASRVASDFSLRASLSSYARSLFDGQGTRRVVSCLAKIAERNNT